jgi:hypothetical protein
MVNRKSEQRHLLKIGQMGGATAIRGAKPGCNHQRTGEFHDHPVLLAFGPAPGAIHKDLLDLRHSGEMINVPVRLLSFPPMARKPMSQSLLGASGVDVATRWKIDRAQASYSKSPGGLQAEHKMVHSRRMVHGARVTHIG